MLENFRIKEAKMSKKVKKLTRSQLRAIIHETVQKKNRPNLADLLFEQQETAGEAGAEVESPAGDYVSMSKDTNIADVPSSELWKQMISGDENSPLYQAMSKATKWAPSALKPAGGAAGLKAWAEGIGESELTGRIDSVVSAISKANTSKFDMPALEGSDADEVADVLDDSEGLGVDVKDAWAGDADSFNAWYDNLPEDIQAKYEAGQLPSKEEMAAATQEEGAAGAEGIATESHLREEKFPRHGRGPFPGAPAVSADAEVDLSKVKGRALAFLSKGLFDDSPGDVIPVKTGGSMSNASMKPTQSNILAAKSLLFAFTKPGGVLDMGGAFATADGDILDGHHRWSGTVISTGGGATHTDVNIVDAPSQAVIPLLTTVGNALGRQQKGPNPDEANESVRTQKADRLIMERWRKLAGLL